MAEVTNEISVSGMLRMTGSNTADFMARVAAHVDDLEHQVVLLKERVAELEGTTNDTK
jgi:hypothetical protein